MIQPCFFGCALMIHGNHGRIFLKRPPPGTSGQTPAAGKCTVFAGGIQRHTLGGRPYIQLVCFACAVQYFILLVAHLIHHIPYHIICGFVRAAY